MFFQQTTPATSKAYIPYSSGSSSKQSNLKSIFATSFLFVFFARAGHAFKQELKSNKSIQLIKKSKLITDHLGICQAVKVRGPSTRPFMLLWNEFKVCGKIIVQNCPFQFWYSKSALTCSSNLSRRFPFCLL